MGPGLTPDLQLAWEPGLLRCLARPRFKNTGFPSAMALGRVLRMRGLPFSATDADIVDFFKAWDVEAVRLCFRQGASRSRG